MFKVSEFDVFVNIYIFLYTFFQVEHLEKDKLKEENESDKNEKLEWIQERMRDDFAANQALRRSFRVSYLMFQMQLRNEVSEG